MAKINKKTTDNTKHWQGCRTAGTLILLVGKQNGIAPLENNLAVS